MAEPYFNEPGYEQEIGTEAGKRHSADYNTGEQCRGVQLSHQGATEASKRATNQKVKALCNW